MESTRDANALFVYGSLLEETTRLEILGRRVEVIEAQLDGFERHRSRYYYIVRADSAVTNGLLLKGLSDADWRRLDAYEEVPDLYTREDVEVTTADGIVRCWVYLPTGKCINLQST